MKKILLIEDDENILEIERDYLEANDFEVEVATDGKVGLEKIFSEDFSLIILDLMLPEVDGFKICKEIRQKKETPILIVSARREEIDKIRALGLGADDYVMKPFSPNELVARVKAHISRYERLTGTNKEKILNFGELEIQPETRRIFLSGKEIFLKNREFELLLFLAENPNIVFSKDKLFDRIWGMDAIGDVATVTVHINRIREKIEPNPSKPKFIETVWGAGYRFKK